MALEKQRKTFLSYSRVNKDFAVQLAKELKSEGFDVWLDQLDIPLGARWDREVEKALRKSEIFMIILTPESVDSENVLDEIGYAIDTGKRILPILLEECDMPLRLRRLQHVDFTTKSFDEGVNAAKGLLRGLIAQPTIPRGIAVSEDTQVNVGDRTEEDHIVDKIAESDSKAKEEADRLAAQKAEVDRKSKEDADRLAKAESDRNAKEEANRIATQNADADKKAKQDADRKAKQEADHKAKKDADHKAKEAKHEPVLASVSSTPSQKKLVSKGLIVGIIAIAVFCVTGIGIALQVISKSTNLAADVPSISVSATKSNATNTPKPTSTQRSTSTSQPSPTPIPAPVILTASEAKKIIDSDNYRGIFSTARDQYTRDEINNFYDNNQPIPITLTDPVPMRVGYNWCAIDQDTLENNLSYIRIIYKLEDKVASSSNIDYSYYTADNGWECVWMTIVIDNWITGSYYVSHEIVLKETINNGESDIEPYTDGNDYIVTVP